MRKIIIDCDPGIDDALALMLALSSPELNILGITTVSGNVPAQVGADNALKVLKQMNRLDIPVYCGAEIPLKKDYVDARDTHGEDGLGETNYPKADGVSWKGGAVDFIIETLQKETGVSIIAIGPMTNLALALQKCPEAFQRLDEFISMGGNFRSYGNCSPVAEYNYWCDPDAANYVYQNLGTMIHMVGLDVTRKIVFTPTIAEFCQRIHPSNGTFVKQITHFYNEFHWNYERIIGCVINDPLAIAYFIDRELCSGISAYTMVVMDGVCIGQTVVDSMDFWKKEKNSYVLTKVNQIDFMKLFLKRVFQAKESDLDILFHKE